MKQSTIKSAVQNQKLVSNEITCKQGLMLRSCTPVTALVYQLVEALRPIYSHKKCFYTVVLEWELVTKFQTPFPPPQAVLSIHSRMFWAEFPSRCFWLVTRQYHKVICKNILENKKAIQGEWCESPSSPHLTWLQQGLIPVLKIKKTPKPLLLWINSF